MGKFNLNQLLNGASMSAGSEEKNESVHRPPLKVVSLNINDLVPSSGNFYSVDNIEELKTSIEMFGVLQNLTVKPRENGKYEIISGHRRHKACVELVREGKTEFEYIPCGVQTEQDEIKERILLIMTNSTARELSDWEKMKQAEELRKNFEELKKRENLTGRVRDYVAEALNTSPTQIARLNAIDNNLTPEFKEEFKEGKIGTSAAYELSGLTEEQQKQAYSDYQEKGNISANEIKEQKRNYESPASLQISKSDQSGKPADLSEKKREYEPPIIEEYPETPNDFEEGTEFDGEDYENRDFADLNRAEKTAAAVDFLNEKRFALFAPGEDTRVFDFIIETLESCVNEI